MKLRILLAGLLIAAAPLASADPITFEANGHRYAIIEVGPGLTWEQARALAEEMGGHLATIGDAASRREASEAMPSH